MNPDDKTCRRCRWLYPVDYDGPEVKTGICRRFPPQFIQTTSPLPGTASAYPSGWAQPMVSAEDDCGEWEARQ